jgi:protoporphyrin/coproporphyrin ferrochelatase
MNKTAIVLINTGTPDSTGVSDVRRYLKQFLGDARVITMPAALRKVLVHGIIVPFRAPKSAALYKKVWTEKGSPLLWYSESIKNKLQAALGDNYTVMLGMRYGNPSLEQALDRIKKEQYSQVILFPLFPQYASSTTGSALELALNEITSWNTIPDITMKGQFYDHPGFINAMAARIEAMDISRYEHILFSYHSLPINHVKATHHGKDCASVGCTAEINDENTFCYQATCYATTRLLAEKLNLKQDCFTTSFQSRFASKWIGPFTDDVLKQKARSGLKSILVVSPAFVTDCLETIVEIGDEYRELFIENGGIEFGRTPCLNDTDEWVDVLQQMMLQKTPITNELMVGS